MLLIALWQVCIDHKLVILGSLISNISALRFIDALTSKRPNDQLISQVIIVVDFGCQILRLPNA